MKRRNTMERNSGNRFFDLDQVQEFLPVSKTVLRREINRGHLRAYKIGGKFYIREPDIKTYLESALVVSSVGDAPIWATPLGSLEI